MVGRRVMVRKRRNAEMTKMRERKREERKYETREEERSGEREGETRRR